MTNNALKWIGAVMRSVLASTALVLPVLICAPSAAVRADNRVETRSLIAPRGLKPCTPSDPVAAAEDRAATSIGGQLLNCFRSEKMIVVPGATALSPMPLEYAFAIHLAGSGYTPADLDKLRSTVTAQWKGFQPLSTEFRDKYIARLNALVKEAVKPSTSISSIKPVLVSIDQLDAKSYTVISIRSYVLNTSGGQVATTKVNADAVVLRGQDLIRLTMQRTLTDVADVAQVRSEISEWARATEDR